MPQQPWTIIVGCKAEIIAEFQIPTHRLDANDLKAFLTALVARYASIGPEDMSNFYINGRRGGPEKTGLAKIISYFHYEHPKVGTWCGTWECYAYATHDISAEDAEWGQKMRDQNMG